MNKVLYHLLLSVFMGLALAGAVRASTSDEINNLNELIEKISDASKPEQLYTVRYNLDRIAAQKDHTIEEYRVLLKAHVLLVNAFKSYNHYKNAIDVQKDYLRNLNNYQGAYTKYLVDSIKASHSQMALTDRDKLRALDNQIAELRSKQATISELRGKYILYGSIITALMLIAGLAAFFNRTKLISTINSEIEMLREKMQYIFKEIITYRITIGTVYSVKEGVKNDSIRAEEIVSYYQQNSDTKSISDSLSALERARAKIAGMEP